MIFFDFEVFKYDWLVVFMDVDRHQETDVMNNPKQLQDYYQENVDNIWVGFNCRHYDKYIFQGILSGFNPKEINDWIIRDGKPGYQFSDVLKSYPLIIYDVMQNIDHGLKWFEGSMGNDIRETEVPFDLGRKLTQKELGQTLHYCRHDVEQTMQVFIERQADFNSEMELIKMFNLPLAYISKTKVQLSAEILGAQYRNCTDEFDIHLPPTMDVHKYTQVPEFFMDPKSHRYADEDGNATKLILPMAGLNMVFGYGGVHGAISKYHSKGYFLNMDVASLYPSLMINYPEYCFSRAVPKSGLERFSQIKADRLKYKHEGNKKMSNALKVVINGTYGASKDKFNKLYDPRAANNTCVFGQILVGVDLFEKLEPYSEIIQVNTDGILIRKPDRITDVDGWFRKIDDIVYEWENRTGLNLEFDDYGYGEIFQKDVNNYIIIDGYDGHYKSKGAYVKSLSRLDYDLPIVNKALVDRMVKGIPVERTIRSCDELIMFQMVRKITYKYSCILYGDKQLNEKCVRVFASVDDQDPGLTKIHAETHNPAKIEGTPEHCFMVNGDIHDIGCPAKLDKNWYIALAKERLEGFGI